MSFKVSLNDMQSLLLAYKGVIDAWKEGVSTVRSKEYVLENSPNISGNSADRMKEYLETVYSFAEGMLFEAMDLFIARMVIYIEDYFQIIDSVDNARIPENELGERYDSLKKNRKKMQAIGYSAETAVDKISDLISITGLDISDQDTELGSIITSIDTLDQEINNLESRHLSEDFTELDELLYRIESFLSEMKNLNKDFKVNFSTTGFASIPSVLPLLEAMTSGYNALDAQQSKLQSASENLEIRLERQQEEMEKRQRRADWIKFGVAIVGTLASAAAVATGAGTLLVPVIVGVSGGVINAIGTQYVANSWDTEKWDTGYIGKEAIKGWCSGFTGGILPPGTGTLVKTTVSGANSALWGSLDESYDQLACTGNISDVNSVFFEGAKSGTSDIAQNLVGDFIGDKVEKLPIGMGLDKFDNPTNDVRHYIGEGIKGSTSKMASGIGERFTEATVESGFDIGKNLAGGKNAFEDVPLGERYGKVLAFDELGKDFVKGGSKEIVSSYYKERTVDPKTGLTPIIQSELGNKTDPETGLTPIVQEALERMENKADYSRTASTPQEEKILREMEGKGEFDLEGAKVGPVSYSSSTMKPLTDKPIEIEFTAKPGAGNYTEMEFADQLGGQEVGFNQSGAAGVLDRMENYQMNGRTDTGDIQENYRLGIFESMVDEKTDEKIAAIMSKHPNMSYEDASKKVDVRRIRNEVSEELKNMDALHDPDQNAGGDPTNIHGIDSSGANRSIGSQWSKGRSEELYQKIKEAAKGMSREELENTRLNIRLKYTVKESN